VGWIFILTGRWLIALLASESAHLGRGMSGINYGA